MIRAPPVCFFENQNSKIIQEEKLLKYSPKKVFVLENGQYTEISFMELQHREKELNGYKEKYFLPLHGMLMEVTKEEYKLYYKEKRRERYIAEQAKEVGAFSYDALTTDEFNGEDILVDVNNSPEEEAEQHLMVEMLLGLFQKLNPDEQALIKAIYFDGMSEREYAAKLGIYHNAVHKRKLKILEKLKKLMKN